ncbi:saccharopine dehydrogenase family protein [Yinghuangia soli]|uniref:Saccharopine dehydrogenase NADP-binding domain-containing protein n=1 Tax=Yinghuangia soli TaxID=2908204 RepID=A0AA41U0E5_9ACTN|nr:saccharopine dehydrogenase NADP-binding domain-containing protein [Yinghuangia soli]MCF2528511.1 saccharopine dehydrogenase NADP-binding domain-containing protein [Yinghuangia soli]
MSADERAYDLVLFGATGFTGGLTAEYLADHAPDGCRWALAGRDLAKLTAVRDRLVDRNPGYADLPLLVADSSDPASLRTLAESTRVLATTVGPYITHGEPLVAACAEAGTDYLDLTGEPEFVDRMYVAHHETAVRTGARLVHACGFDSIPHDLGVAFTVAQLPEGVPIRVEGQVRAGGTISGGTFASALTSFSRLRASREAVQARRRLEKQLAHKAEPDAPAARSARAIDGRPRRDPDTGDWLMPLPTIDPQVIARSARALDRYGPDFTYSHYASVRRLPIAVAGAAGVAALVLLAHIPPARRALQSRLAPGDGPSPERRAKAWFAVRFVGTGGGERVVTEVRGGDPGYTETSKMLAEAALCLAYDDLPTTSGQVTTATAMGDALTTRLQAAGIEFRRLEPAEPPKP